MQSSSILEKRASERSVLKQQLMKHTTPYVARITPTRREINNLPKTAYELLEDQAFEDTIQTYPLQYHYSHMLQPRSTVLLKSYTLVPLQRVIPATILQPPCAMVVEGILSAGVLQYFKS